MTLRTVPTKTYMTTEFFQVNKNMTGVCPFLNNKENIHLDLGGGLAQKEQCKKKKDKKKEGLESREPDQKYLRKNTVK